MKTNKVMIGIMACLILALPFAFAEANKISVAKEGKEYPLISRISDRIRLLFTYQIERRVELMNSMLQRRAEHYQFLVAHGKTDQALKFNSTTIGLIKNFDAWNTNKLGIVAKMENKTMKYDNSTPKYGDIPGRILNKTNAGNNEN